VPTLRMALCNQNSAMSLEFVRRGAAIPRTTPAPSKTFLERCKGSIPGPIPAVKPPSLIGAWFCCYNQGLAQQGPNFLNYEFQQIHHLPDCLHLHMAE